MRATLLLPLLAVALAGPAWADPPKAPTLAVVDPVTPPRPTPADVLDLPPGRFELVKVAGYAGKVTWRASGPQAVVEPLPPRSRVWFVAPTPGATVDADGPVRVALGLKAGAAGPTRHDLGDEPAALLRPGAAGEATVEGWGVVDGAAVPLVSLRVRSGAAPQPPPVTPDPGQPAGGLYFVVVRPAGPASPAFTAAMSLPEWQTLRAAGHRVKDFDPARAVELLGAGVVPAGTQLPVVVTLREQPGGSTVVRGPVPLPTAGAGVLELPKGVR